MSKDIDCADLLKKALAVAGHADLADTVQVSDAATFLKDPEKARSTIASGVPVLLSGVTEQQKETLYQYIGLGLKGRSEFLFIWTSPDRNGQPCHYVADTGDLSAIPTPEIFMAEGHGKLEPATGPGGGPAELPAESESGAPLPDIASEPAPLQTFCDGAARIVGYSTSAGDYPPNAVYKEWFRNVFFPWDCPKSTTWNGFTPQYQKTHGTVDFKIAAFLNEAASGNFQWVYHQTLGFWSTGGKMNKNDYNEKGWATGTVGVSVEMPIGFTTYDMSPKNTNNETQVTSSTSFQVASGSASGVGGSYTVSNSETESIRDWGVTLTDEYKWRFMQTAKFDASGKGFPADEVYWSHSKFRYELYALPTLSSNVFDFCTMSVFRNSKVQTGRLTLNSRFDCQYFYLAIESFYPTYSGKYWTKNYRSIPIPVIIDMSLVSKPKPV
jgi:hypothetical protein